MYNNIHIHINVSENIFQKKRGELIIYMKNRLEKMVVDLRVNTRQVFAINFDVY